MVRLKEMFNVRDMCYYCRNIVIFLILSLIVLNLFDIITTFIGMTYFGLGEGNMNMVWLFERYGVPQTILMKMGVIFLYCLFMFAPVHFFHDKVTDIKLKYNWFTLIVLWIFSLALSSEVFIYVKVVFYNIKTIVGVM